MAKFLRLLQTLDYMRMVVGICILVDGYPLIFFFRDTLKLAPGSSAFTAAGFAGGLILMVPFTVLRRLYRPNITMFWIGMAFILTSILYMYVYPSPEPLDYTREMIYYAYILIFLFLLINIPNDIIPVVVPIVVLFTLVSNLGLIYSLITNPTWAIGQRATIVLNNSDDGSGNPHVFARNAFMGIIACVMWLVRPQTNVLFRLLAFFSGVVSVVILLLTQTRSSILALILVVALFFYFNVRPAQIRATVRSLFTPVPIIVAVLGIVGVIVFFQRYGDIYAVLYGYAMGFMERNLDNIYAFLGLQSQGVDYKATLDDSVANRAVNFGFLTKVLVSQAYMLIPGYGYKFSYLDVPMLEALTSQGVLGLALFGTINAMSLRHSLRTMRENSNPMNIFLAYFYMLVFVQIFSGGRPYEITFWFPLALMIRFMGVEHLFPAYLMDHSVAKNDKSSTYVVVQNGTV
ncbi:O-antigen ligase family protein [Spirosoma endophyticum]|uniref:Oligosaccharide repeat unit polymerase n=1 Tax=Spirosoma endophyticum TaxID=662367 RepID=A0A1I2AQC3_9BACT|nr:hypothetical protein [Spirosoma endophyticum]SFE46151.1 hypothetical protein SAMN05216167_11453 [Spirosoma endophyticum]